MRLFILYDIDTKEWTIVIQSGGNFVASSLFGTTNAIHAFIMAAGYLSIFNHMTIDPTSELAWRQLGLKVAPTITAMQ